MDSILNLIAASDSAHSLRAASDGYRSAFANAFLAVYAKLSHPQQVDALRSRFCIGQGVRFDAKLFAESAVELSVQNHLHSEKGFEAEKKVNPTNDKDVDAFFCRKSHVVSVEVKCIHQERHPDGVLIMKFAGRNPDPRQLGKLGASIEEHSAKKAVTAKNRDHRIKDHLLSAHNKFNPDSSVDDLNVLFLACGDYHDMREVWDNLFNTEGLFTPHSFHPPSEFQLVDVVILSNLRYRHEKVKEGADWTLSETFVLPFLNPRRRSNALASTISEGLNAFPHHLREFNGYIPEDRLKATDEQITWVIDMLKLPYYVSEKLSKEERTRYFPTIDFDKKDE